MPSRTVLPDWSGACSLRRGMPQMLPTTATLPSSSTCPSGSRSRPCVTTSTGQITCKSCENAQSGSRKWISRITVCGGSRPDTFQLSWKAASDWSTTSCTARRHTRSGFRSCSPRNKRQSSSNLCDDSQRLFSHFFQRQLTAGGHHIAPARIPSKRRDPFFQQDFVKSLDTLFARLFVGKGTRIPGNQVHFYATEIGHEARNAARVLRLVVHAAEQNIFKCDVLARASWEVSTSRQQFAKRIFLVDGHQHVALFIVRCIQRNRKFRPYWLLCQPFDSRHDATGRKRHMFWSQPDS